MSNKTRRSDMKRKIIIGTTVVVLLICITLWGAGVIPKTIGEISAKSYVSTVHSDLGLNFSKLDFSQSHGSYFAIFTDVDGNIISFQMNGGKFLPLGVWKDPLKNPS
jgi:hypothetical protein